MRNGGAVDAAPAGRKPVAPLGQAACEAGEDLAGGLIVHVPQAGDGDGYGRDVAQVPLKCGRQGAGDEDVLTHVGANVYARHHKVRGSLQQTLYTQNDAVRRGALHGEGPAGP